MSTSHLLSIIIPTDPIPDTLKAKISHPQITRKVSWVIFFDVTLKIILTSSTEIIDKNPICKALFIRLFLTTPCIPSSLYVSMTVFTSITLPLQWLYYSIVCPTLLLAKISLILSPSLIIIVDHQPSTETNYTTWILYHQHYMNNMLVLVQLQWTLCYISYICIVHSQHSFIYFE